MEVEMDVAGVNHHHHHQQQQELSSQTLESMLQVCTKPETDKKPRPPEEALKCPRCDSGNTKFCYYNNYSLTQPRYFCKSCRRYWTKGGTLRNVPVGGGCRKNKRSSSSSSSATSSNSSCSAPSKIRGSQDHHFIQQHPLNFMTNNCSNSSLLAGLPQLPYDSTCTDLSLAFARLQSQANGSMGYHHFDHNNHHLGGGSSSCGNNNTNVDHLGFLDVVRGGFIEPTTNLNHPNHRFHHNLLYNGDMVSVGNLMGLNNVSTTHDQEQQQQQMLNNQHIVFNDHQEQDQLTCSAATTAVTVTSVKQEACNNMMRSSEIGLWGFPLQMGAEVESGRSMIGGWNGIGSTNWHGLINSPLM